MAPATMSLSDPHLALRVAVEWQDIHLHAFELPSAGSHGESQRFSDSDMELEQTPDEWAYTVGQLLGTPRDPILYNYDFGDGWRHKIMVEKILGSTTGQAVRCSGGRMRVDRCDVELPQAWRSGATWGHGGNSHRPGPRRDT